MAGGDLLDQVAQPGELGAQAVVDVDQVLAGGLLVGRVAALGVGRRAAVGRVVSSQAASPLTRAPSSGVGVTANGRAPSGGAASGAAAAAPRAARVDELAHPRRRLLGEAPDVVGRARPT